MATWKDLADRMFPDTVHTPEELIPQFRSAKSEAKKAFGIDDIFIEKYLERPKHIEVQILGDNYGNLVHLYERTAPSREDIRRL